MGQDDGPRSPRRPDRDLPRLARLPGRALRQPAVVPRRAPFRPADRLDLYESGAFLLQLRGLFTGLKVTLLALLPLFGSASVWVVGGIAFLAVISSHASSRFRYFLIWGRGRIKASESRG
jgi:hypothetical protein